VLTARGWELLAAAAAVLVAVWVWRAIYRPTAPCRWCRGRKKVGSSKRWRKRTCRFCKDTPGERMTWGARMLRGGRWGK
jgi:hypothetical protein